VVNAVLVNANMQSNEPGTFNVAPARVLGAVYRYLAMGSSGSQILPSGAHRDIASAQLIRSPIGMCNPMNLSIRAHGTVMMDLWLS
jgi:hypothetical protein